MFAHLARALDDSLHGRLDRAPDEYLRALAAARTSADPRAPFVAWYAATKALALSDDRRELFRRWEPLVDRVRVAPQRVGWRARWELVDWWLEEQHALARPNIDELAVEQLGCVTSVRLAGPFGSGASPDVVRSYPAERPGPWPHRWVPEPGVSETPRVLRTERNGCSVGVDESVGQGVYYAETYLKLERPVELLLAVQGALAVWVDDRLVLDRDVRRWGIWPRFGISLDLKAGRHRVLARLSKPRTSIRLLFSDGLPAALESSQDPTPAYCTTPPKLLDDPNLVSRFVGNGDVIDPRDDLLRAIVASLADVEGQGDLASLIFEPLIADVEQATGPALEMAAAFAASDPIFESKQAQDLVHELYERAQQKDNKLFASRLGLALWDAERSDPGATVQRLKALAAEFRHVPAVLAALARAYQQLAWEPESITTVEELHRRFPNHLQTLHAAVDVYDSVGEAAAADAAVERILRLDPDNEIRLTRALAREDYTAAITELKRLAKRRPEREGLVERLQTIMLQAGLREETLQQLEAAVAEHPRQEAHRLALADARLAAGKHAALRDALADALVHGAPTDALEGALDAVEGMTELAPYRIPALPVILEYERAGRHMPGTAARVLDYAAVWVRSDGSSRMLEHEVVRIQSSEALSAFAEHQRLSGLALQMRVIKKDGRILEPEYVPGKPTVTLPHLEVGDYIETEHVMSLAGGDRFGSNYVGPHWFFREANVAYARSELVVITPTDKALMIETQGDVPEPSVEESGPITIRRWRADFSPAAPVEPLSPPALESLPNVRVGWGVTLEQRLKLLSQRIEPLEPVDPRIRRIAKRLVRPFKNAPRERGARALYRWILDNVQPGEETDGRRVVIGKQGNRWHGFIMLCRALDIPVHYAIARNRFAAGAPGPISLAQQFSQPILRIDGSQGPLWLILDDSSGRGREKYLPFGYLPPGLRGTDAYLIAAGEEPQKVQTPTSAGHDAIAYEGQWGLLPNGAAKAQLVLRSTGRHAMDVRGGLARLPSSRIHDTLESEVVGRALRGAELIDHEVKNLDAVDRPLEIAMDLKIPGFARKAGAGWHLAPPFTPNLSRLAVLPSRKTPLVLNGPVEHSVKLRVTLPRGLRVASKLGKLRIQDGQRFVVIRDRVEQGVLILDREVVVPAGRISTREYQEFARFVRRADHALAQTITLQAAR